MRNYEQETKNRVAFIQAQLKTAGATGIVYGNSGGKDSALVGILCKKACDDTVGIQLPISARNYDLDMRDGREVADKFGIATRVIALADVKAKFIDTLTPEVILSDMATANMSARLRMITLYAVSASENRLVAGTGNRSEAYMGYFTKWGDGAHDFNPIGDLTVTEIYEFLKYLGAPESVITKAPSAALFDGQTDESEMGITYAAIDDYLINGKASDADRAKIEEYHARSEHKRNMPITYGG
ncbi:MAG: NAD(+) synthase, partial [Oscillospiraceae bacterium]|jgi:NAD+ synthase|nr:NAD(+) synthase [Oscillospiraceae bacterium]